MNSREIGAKISRIRKNREMTRNMLAKEVGTAASTVGMWERGERIPRDSMKVRLAQTFNMTVQELFF